MKTSKRGLVEFNMQPSQEWLETHDRFSFKSSDGLRITFHKRHREGRKPTWNGVVHRKGKSYCAYAGTSQTFDVIKVVQRLSKSLAANR